MVNSGERKGGYDLQLQVIDQRESWRREANNPGAQLGKGGQANDDEPGRPIRAGQRVIHTPLNNRERGRPRDIRGIEVHC
jgi:hypothetical protein